MSDGIAQAIHNGPALPRDALALQLRGVRGALRGLHHSDLVRLGSHQCGLPQALLLVDLVHGLRHVVVRHEVDHQGLVNLEAVLGHLRRQLAVDAISHLIFFFERLVQSHGRNERADDVRDIRLNLAEDITELVHGEFNPVRLHRLLNRHSQRDKDVVPGLRLHHHYALHHTAGHGAEVDATAAQIAPNAREPWRQPFGVSAEAFYRVVLVLWHSDDTIRSRDATILDLRHHCVAMRRAAKA
mmetsp:Transcript_75104/g.244166  ORF Transcript_75104/g.244166 Transcript_75104/m.244166 type:complete len:242 (-) Transcript_75104:17-742(-)